MFSDRLDWSLPANRISEALARRRAAGAEILDLTESNPTAAGLAYPAERILTGLASPGALRYEPAAMGLAAARSAVAGYYDGRGIALSPEDVLLTASTSEAYAYLFKLLADPGDEILIPRPSYPLFDFLARLESVRTVHYPLYYDHGWALDFERLENAAGPRTCAVVIVNPNNPTGSFIKRRELERLVDFCGRRGLALVSDEVFADYSFVEDSERVTTVAGVEGALTFALSGLSKICGMPQMKLGWMVAGGPPEVRCAALERLELVADTYLSVGTPVQHAVASLLEAGANVRLQIQSRVRENLTHLRAALAGTACQALEAEGGWYSVLRVPKTKTEEEWVLDLLERDGVLVQPGYFFDFESEAYLVISLLTDPEIFRCGVACVSRRAGGGAD